jgi:hypothetical protein
LSRLTGQLVGFSIASSVLVTAALVALGEPSVWNELCHFASGTQGVDSWRPMSQAHAYLSQGAEQPLYRWLFFDRHVKFIYPPTSLLLLDVLPRSGLRATLNAGSWLLVWVTVVFSVLVLDRNLQASRHTATSPRDRALRAGAALLLALTFYPVLKAYSLGQMQVWVNALFAACAWCWISGRRAAAGVLVALMAAVKPQYALIALWGLLRGERRFAAAAAAAGLLLLVASVARFGLESHLDYLSVLAHVSRHGEAYWPNQTVGGFLHRLLGNGVSSHWDPHVYPPYHPVVYLGSLAASALILLLAFAWPVRGPGRGGALDFAAAALATTLASPIAWEHHYGVLLPIFACLLPAVLDGRPEDAARQGSRGFGLPLLALAYLVSAHYLDALRRLDATPWNPLQSLLLFTALGVFGALLALRARAPDAPPPSVRHS